MTKTNPSTAFLALHRVYHERGFRGARERLYHQDGQN